MAANDPSSAEPGVPDAETRDAHTWTWERLPLVPMERYLLLNDTPRSPMVFRVALRFGGQWDRELLSFAYRRAIARQPLFNCLIHHDQGGPVWSGPAPAPEIEWHPAGSDESAILAQDVEPLDLCRQPGCRIRGWPLVDGLMIVMEAHHACCDGQGCRQFLWDWMHAYSEMVVGNQPQFVPLDVKRLPQRGHFTPISAPVQGWEGVRNLYVTIRGRNVRMPTSDAKIPHSGRKAWLAQRSFSSDETDGLRRELKKQSMTMNDLGLASCITVIAEQFPELWGRRHIMVANTMDLRRPSDLQLPACNRLGLAFIRRRRRDWKSFPELLSSLREQLQYIKRKYVGVEVVHGLTAAASVPGGLWAVLHSGLFTPTLQFTSMGDTTRAIRYRMNRVGDEVGHSGLFLQWISGIPPLGWKVPLGVSTCETNNRLTLAVRASSRSFTDSQTRVFLEAITGRFLAFAAGAMESRLSG